MAAKLANIGHGGDRRGDQKTNSSLVSQPSAAKSYESASGLQADLDIARPVP